MSSGSEGSSLWRIVDASGAAYPVSMIGASQQLFPAVDPTSIRERMISNPSSTATIYVNLSGQAAAANGSGTFALGPLGTLFSETCNLVTAIGTAGQPVTCKER